MSLLYKTACIENYKLESKVIKKIKLTPLRLSDTSFGCKFIET